MTSELTTAAFCALCLKRDRKSKLVNVMFFTSVILFLSCMEFVFSSSNSDFSSIKRAHDGSVLQTDYKTSSFQLPLPQLHW